MGLFLLQPMSTEWVFVFYLATFVVMVAATIVAWPVKWQVLLSAGFACWFFVLLWNVTAAL